MERATAEARISARMPVAVYERVVEAAQAVGATLNQFMVQSALDRANEVLERERTIRLSGASARKFLDLLENPPEPTERLRKAMKRHKRMLRRE